MMPMIPGCFASRISPNSAHNFFWTSKLSWLCRNGDKLHQVRENQSQHLVSPDSGMLMSTTHFPISHSLMYFPCVSLPPSAA